MVLSRAARTWIAVGALAAALALLAPSVVPLSGSMDAFAQDLANGTFKPFGQLGVGNSGSGGLLSSFGSALGGFTGTSAGNFMPGAGDVPDSWTLDRDGHGGVVTIDSVFDPDLGAMKRLKAFDGVSADGTTLRATDTRLLPLTSDPTLRYDRTITGSFPVQFHANQPVPIFSPHPKAVIQSFATEPRLAGSVSFYHDAEDTYYAVARETKVATLNITYLVSTDYYSLPPISGVRTSDYAVAKPTMATGLQQDAQAVLARAGVTDPTDVGDVLSKLSAYFRSFTEGDIPQPSEVESLYLALALGGHGCCRHRAFAFLVTAESVGIPTRVVVNEAHAFVEVQLPDRHWHQINLGGCGAFVQNNPNHYPSFFDQAVNPRTEANADETTTTAVPRVATFTNITSAPERIVKGETFRVQGTVLDASGRGVPGARIDLYLNATKTSAGRLTGAGSTGSDGRFSIVARVPADAPAQGYQLVARGTDGRSTTTRYAESWSDPAVQVFAATKFTLASGVGAAGFPLNVSGKLTDSEGGLVANAPIDWSLDNATWHPARTDTRGLFTVAVNESQVRTDLVTFRYLGDANHGPATGTTTARFGTGAIVFPAIAPTLTRGKSGDVGGAVVIQGTSLGGREVNGVLNVGGGASSTVTTRPDGTFTLHFAPTATTPPGVYRLAASVDSLSLSASHAVRVAAGATLLVDAPAIAYPGNSWTLVATLASDNGTRIPGGIVNVTIGTSSRELLTNNTGVARFDYDPGAIAPGPHTLKVTFPGDADHVEAAASQPFEIAKPFTISLPPWVAVAVLAALALAVGIVLIARRGRALVALRPQLRYLSVAFPDHPPGVAPVFEPGDVARVRVLVRDRKGRARVAGVAIGPVTGRTQGEAGATLDVRMPSEPTALRLKVRARGLARAWTRSVVLHVPVMSFRQAVESGFVDLRERVAGLGKDATPGDVLRRLGPRLRGEPPREALRRAARLFELADYAENARVDRAFYHDFSRAAQEAADGVP